MTDPGNWPSHAYIPGLTRRHPEGAFEAILQTLDAGQSPDALARSFVFQQGLRFLDAGFYWEAHEMFEPIWMALPKGSGEKRFVQGMIQIANGMLKLRMNRPKAARRLAGIARDLLPEDRHGQVMGVKLTEAHDLVDALETEVNVEL